MMLVALMFAVALVAYWLTGWKVAAPFVCIAFSPLLARLISNGDGRPGSRP